jgi:hypothetical protein
MTKASGGEYSGGFNGGLRDGTGTYTYADGSTYVGEFKYGLKHGQGTYTFPDGAASHTGMYADGLKHGPGIYRVGKELCLSADPLKCGSLVRDILYTQRTLRAYY